MSTHGARRSYAAGCRCVPCRSANAAYTAARRLAPPVRVEAAAARLHLQQLQALGLGTRQLARLSGLSRGTIVAVLAGIRLLLPPSTAAQLLAVRPVLARGCSVPATRTWRYVDSLHREGFTRRQIGWMLGAAAQQLQLNGRRVRVRSALRVAQLHDRIAL